MLAALRKIMPFLFVATAAALLYDGWLFYSRWHEAREGERMRQESEAAEARRTIDMLGGGQLKILNFYASPPAIRRGERAEVCYGVFGATSVRIEPGPAEGLPAAVSHCFEASPRETTKYTLTAKDASGRTAEQQVTLQVRP